MGVNGDGRREVLGMAVGPSEAETFWTDFLRGLTRRGLRGVKLVISDAHEGLKAAVTRVLRTTWQRCRVPSPGLPLGVPAEPDRLLAVTDHTNRHRARRKDSAPHRVSLDRHRARRGRRTGRARPMVHRG